MGKKLKELAGDVTESQLASTVKESAQQIWLAGLGAFAKAQEEGGKVFDALVKEGESIQSRTRKMTDERIAQVAGKAAGDLGSPGAGISRIVSRVPWAASACRASRISTICPSASST
jgi:hypothetical protein